MRNRSASRFGFGQLRIDSLARGHDMQRVRQLFLLGLG